MLLLNISWKLYLLLYLTGHALGKSAYYYSRYTATWFTARDDCVYAGGHLLDLQDPGEYDFIAPRLKYWLTPNGWYWIGLSDLDVEGKMRWTDGTLAGPQPWHGNEPDNINGADCTLIILNEGLKDGVCSNEGYFICEVESTPEALAKADILSCWVGNDLLRPVRDVDTEIVIKCPRNILYYSPHATFNKKTWTEGKTFCEEAHSSLAKITSEAELTIVDKMRKVKAIGDLMIGGTDVVVEGEYRWADGENFTWPDFLTVSKPADDTSKNCLIVIGTAIWAHVDCNVQYPILCEMHVDHQSRAQACYWNAPPGKTWPEQLQVCEEGGGTLANLRHVGQYERARRAFTGGLRLFIGMTHFNETFDFRWTDGSFVIWAWWHHYPQVEPNQENALYAATYNFYAYSDEPPSRKNYEALCEKAVASFQNADVIHTLGGIEVECHNLCQFMDGTSHKTWTCQDELPQEYIGCSCPEGGWFVQEPWLSHLNISVLSDNDNQTCLNAADIDSILTLRHETPLRNGILVEVAISESHHHELVRVLKTEDESDAGNYCSQQREFSKCLHTGGHTYFCVCSSYCQVQIKLLLASELMTVSGSFTVCEIRLVN